MIKFNKMSDEELMTRCIALARKGSGQVSPNPMVGCVIVKDNKIIVEGYHKKYEDSHAEINAIKSAKKAGISLKGSTMYINLEPCSHFGNTPPCVDEIIKHKISKVVIGTKDPNPLVAGHGIRKLKKNKIKVIKGVLENECIELNKFFLKYIKAGLPYVTLKIAQSLDGKIADKNYKSKWISSFKSRQLVHKLRSQYDAVLVGRRTVEIDNPELTVRYVQGRNPYSIVIDRKLKLALDRNIFKDRGKTIIITSKNSNGHRKNKLLKSGITIIEAKLRNNKIDLKDALKKVAELHITSILVEGGAFTFTEFLKQKVADELIIFISPKIMGEGIPAFLNKTITRKTKIISCEKSDNDVMINYKL